MGYLRGDYYGDYYGDPSIFGSIAKAFGKATQFVGHLAGGLLPGPIGAGVRAILPFAAGGERTALTSTVGSNVGGNPSTMLAIPPPPSGMPFGGTMPGGGGIVTQSPLGTPVHPAAIAMQVARLRRTHLNKETYVIRGGGTSRWGPAGQLTVIPKGTQAVPNRRMNVANPRAIRRALRRVAGFAKLTKRVRRAVSMAASAVGVHRRARKAIRRR